MGEVDPAKLLFAAYLLDDLIDDAAEKFPDSYFSLTANQLRLWAEELK